MCSGAALDEHSPGAVSFISVFLALAIIVSILFRSPNFLTMILALGGGVLVALSELYTGSLTAYYLGAWLLLSAIVIDGGWLRFLWGKLTRIML